MTSRTIDTTRIERLLDVLNDEKAEARRKEAARRYRAADLLGARLRALSADDPERVRVAAARARLLDTARTIRDGQEVPRG